MPNRTALNQILSGDDSVVCVDCHPTLMEEAEQYRNPDTWAARQAERRREKQSINEVYAEAEEFWIRSHREVLQRTYALLCQPEDQLPRLSVRQELAALAVVRNAAKGGIISLKEHLTLPPLSPDNRDVETLVELRAHEVLHIHPSTPMESMCWRIGSFSEAVAHAEGDLGSLPAPELTGSYFPYRTRFYVSYGRDLQGAVSSADTELLRRLTHALNDYERFAALERLLAEVIAEEGVRYFDHKLMEHHLPAVPEERRPRLREAAEKVAQVRCLGQLYFAAWAATRDAAAAARRHPRSPLASMTEHGLRRFETLTQEMVQDDSRYAKTFAEESQFPLSAMARTLFHTVLDMNPMGTSLPQLQSMRPARPAPAESQEVSPPPVATAEEAEPELVHPALDDKEFPAVELQARQLAADPGSWSPRDFATAFQTVREDISLVWDADHPSHSTLQAATGALEVHLLQLSPYLKEREAILATVLAAGLYRELIGARPNALPAGRVVVGLLVEALFRRERAEKPAERADDE
ncbi:hypothetical protein ABZ249_11220 [Nocardiopsis sp. NPDC006139]|uniref:hypothetical protein n=1 Tax=Nocardiopsis sp. NPDC006139 TaxID=3154578 RepID=UPI0033BC7017